MIKGFRDFIMRGNVIDLAVAVIIGTAFTSIVDAFAEGIITPLIGALFGQPDFSQIVVGPLQIGMVLNAIVSFLITAFVVYFFIVAPMNELKERFMPKEPEPQPTRECPECLSKVPVAARRCSFCTVEIAPVRA
jgi:large conductance mechanosensitive channel